MKTNSWIFYSGVVLGVITAASVTSTLVLTLLNQPVPKLIITIGLVALAGLVRLLTTFTPEPGMNVVSLSVGYT